MPEINACRIKARRNRISHAASVFLLSFAAGCSAQSAPGDNSLKNVQPPIEYNRMVVSGDEIRIDRSTQICVSANVTLLSGIDPVGRNALNEAALLAQLHGWAHGALGRHGQQWHQPSDESAPRVGRSENCGAGGIIIKGTLEPNASGEPYQLRLEASQADRTLTTAISRNGIAPHPGGAPVSVDSRLPDGRLYWDMFGDLRRSLETLDSSITWIAPPRFRSE